MGDKLKFTLGRKIDIHYPTNRWLLIIMLLIASIVSLISGSVKEGIYTGVGFFFAWGLTREIDPPKEYSAFISGFISLVLIFFYDGVNLAPLFFILLTIRFISGITGYRPTYVDIISLILFAGFLTYSRENPVYFLILFLMFMFSYSRYSKDKIYLFSSVIALLISIVSSYFYKTEEILSSVPFNWKIFTVFAVFILLASFFLISSLNKEKGIEDDLGGIIKAKIIVKALTFFIISIILILSFEKVTQSTQIILLSTILGAAIGRSLGISEVKKKRPLKGGEFRD